MPSTTSTCSATWGTPPCRWVTTTAQQHFYGLALSRARESGAVMVVVYALQRLCFGYLVAATGRGCAAAPKKGSRSAPAWDNRR